MKLYVFIFVICILNMFNVYQYACYQEIIPKNATIWKKTYIDSLANPDHLKTLIDILLLSYQLAQESCIMIIAKLTIQEELFKIYTPSLTDSWQTNMQVLNNDTTKIEQAVQVIKTSQVNFKILFEKIKLIANKLLQINPQPTQILINDLKQGLLAWAKEQSSIKIEIDMIQEEFLSAITTIADFKNIFSETLQSSNLNNNQLKQTAGSASKSYKDIESVFDHFTKLRKTTMFEINHFFNYFFKTYYSIIYEVTYNNSNENSEKALLHPNDIFISIKDFI
ncbi:hypothetical protein HYV10_02850 [Candidatus Dependentiae bacterium]|nr:hypothetical protein [Candidatus Dependentiae bacterium]